MSLITMGASGDDASGPLINFDFTTGTAPATLTVARASTGTTLLFDGTGSSATINNNLPRFVAGRGLLAEASRTQNLGVTDAPATQTVTLGTGSFTLWVLGTGNCAVTAGTGTATGLGTATSGTPTNFTVTGAGTFTFTVAGSLTQFQCENSAYATSYIPNAGAAGTTVTRAVEVPSVDISGIVSLTRGLPIGITIIGKVHTPAGTSAGTQEVMSLDAGANNRIQIRRLAGSGNFTTIGLVGGVTQFTQTLFTSSTNSADLSFWLAVQSAALSGQVIGQTVQSTGTAFSLPSGLTTLRLGTDDNSVSQWDATITKVQIFARRLSNAQAAAIAGAL